MGFNLFLLVSEILFLLSSKDGLALFVNSREMVNSESELSHCKTTVSMPIDQADVQLYTNAVFARSVDGLLSASDRASSGQICSHSRSRFAR